MNWNNARKHCQGLKGDLASFKNEEEQNKAITAIKNLSVRLVSDWWIGLTYDEKEGWVWSDGRSVSWTSSGYDMNNNLTGYCGYLYAHLGKWYALECFKDSFQGFICRIPSEW